MPMTTQVSFAQFFQLAPGLIALDKELDADGCPVPYRKYFAADWLSNREWKQNEILNVQSSISELGLDVQSLCSTWYNNVYGHVVYEPPASRFIAIATPIPVPVTWSPLDLECTLPDITLIQYELEETLSNLLVTDGTLLTGLKIFQQLPMAKWVWLAMADYDISVTSFELARPAYHLALWHSLQTLEKLLKATLFELGETEKSIRGYSHDIEKLVAALVRHGISLTNRGAQIAKEISKLVGGPAVRYLDDSISQTERLKLADCSIKTHHLLLEFFSCDADQIGLILASGAIGSPIDEGETKSDQELRRMVHIEHKAMCSHSAYSMPTYALPIRRDITHTAQSSHTKTKS